MEKMTHISPPDQGLSRSDFWSLAGSLKSEIIASDEELREARSKFFVDWAEYIIE